MEKTENKDPRVLTDELKKQLLKVLFPFGHSDNGNDCYIGPVPGRWNYNIMEFTTDSRLSESNEVFHLIFHKMDDEEKEGEQLGFYVGMMSYAFPMFYSNAKDFDDHTYNVLSFKWVPNTDKGPFWGKIQ